MTIYEGALGDGAHGSPLSPIQCSRLTSPCWAAPLVTPPIQLDGPPPVPRPHPNCLVPCTCLPSLPFPRCPICLDNEDDHGRYGMCFECGQLYCGDCTASGLLPNECPTCRFDSRGAADVVKVQQVRKMLERSPGRHTRNAQYCLGDMYLNGCGVPTNYKKAFLLFRLAAKEGDSGAQQSLGYMYANGFGVEQNLDKSEHWWKLAADQGTDAEKCQSALQNIAAARAKKARATPTPEPTPTPTRPVPFNPPALTQCVLVAPTKLGDTDAAIRAAIAASTMLPVPGYAQVQDATQEVERAHVAAVMGWPVTSSTPNSLIGYTACSTHKDISIWCNLLDKTSPVNELATNAFSIYGPNGEMATGPPRWGPIRGTVVIIRAMPSNMAYDSFGRGTRAVYAPLISADEVYDTLVYFRDAWRNEKKSAFRIAQQRDEERMRYHSMREGLHGFVPGKPAPPSVYVGPTHLRDSSANPNNHCAHCRKKKDPYALKQCSRCRVVRYCGAACQRAAWATHKHKCHTNHNINPTGVKTPK